jgi:hypothetical protein
MSDPVEGAVQEPKAGFYEGVLYCYGGCGTRYEDFPRDISLPTALWNRIAVGHPFDESQDNIYREGRGGVLCPTCIIRRLAALPECTVVFADIDSPPINAAQAEIAALRVEQAQLQQREAECHDVISEFWALTDPETADPDLVERVERILGAGNPDDGCGNVICRQLATLTSSVQSIIEEMENWDGGDITTIADWASRLQQILTPDRTETP